MRHFSAFTGSLFLASTCALHSASYQRKRADMPPPQQIVQAEEPSYIYDSAQKSPKNLGQGIKGHGFFVSADFLYWTADEDGLEYAFKYHNTASQDFMPVEGKLKDLSFEWSLGFRACVGYQMHHDAWDLNVGLTHFATSASGSTHTDDHQTLGSQVPGRTNIAPLWFPTLYNNATIPPSAPAGGDSAQRMSAHWHLDYDTLDLELGRHYFVSRTLSLRPLIGIRAARIEQTYGNKASGGTFPTHPSPETTLRIHNDYRGVGLRAGVQCLYHCTKHWAFYGNLSGSILWGILKLRNTIEGINPLIFPPLGGAPTGGFPGTLFSSKFHARRLRSNVDLGIGFQWETLFNKDRMHLAFSAGYEMLEWFRQNQMQQYLNWNSNASGAAPSNNFNAGFNIPQEGDLGLQGLTASGRFDF